MLDLIQFETFIAEDTLKIFYVLCAVLLPIVCWYWLRWLLSRYAGLLRLYRSTKHSVPLLIVLWVLNKFLFFRKHQTQSLSWSELNIVQKTKLIVVFLLLVFLAEIFLRLMFEYLIAFMQMHESLQAIRIKK